MRQKPKAFANKFDTVRQILRLLLVYMKGDRRAEKGQIMLTKASVWSVLSDTPFKVALSKKINE